MASMPDTVKVKLELHADTVAEIRQLVREEIANAMADFLSRAVHRRDGTGWGGSS